MQQNQTQQSELRIPVFIPEKRQLIMHESAHLLSVGADERDPGMSAETQAKTDLRDRGLRTLKILGPIESVEGVQGFALYNEIGRPVELKGSIDPRKRMGLFSIDRVMANEKHFDGVDFLLIQQAVQILYKHLRHLA